MRPHCVPAPIVLYEQPMLYKDHSIMDSMYIPNNPQYGLQLEYCTTATYPTAHYHSSQPSNAVYPSSAPSPGGVSVEQHPCTSGVGNPYRHTSGGGVILPSSHPYHIASSNYNLNGTVGPSLTPITTGFNHTSPSTIAINTCDPTHVGVIHHEENDNLNSPTQQHHHHPHPHQHSHQTPGDLTGASDVLVSADVLCCSNCGTGQLCCGAHSDPHCGIQDSGGGQPPGDSDTGLGLGGAIGTTHSALDCCDDTGQTGVIVSDITLTEGPGVEVNHTTDNVYNISGIVNSNSNNNVTSNIGGSSSINYNSGSVYTNSIAAPGSGATSAYWATDVDMGTFSLPPLDLDPLPSLFPFSPCSANNFKSECITTGSTQTPAIGVKQPHDMADVLLSLKHAVVHPGQTSSSSGGGAAPLSPPNFAAAAAYPQQSQLSYTMHPHQMLMSPTTYSTGFCDQGGMFAPTNGGCQNHQPSAPSAMFPSMSVNVSMNMTMHGYPPPYPESIQHQVTCPQMQWSTSPQNASPVYHQQSQGGILSPGYPGGATYSFTADFRTPTGESPLITTTSSFKPVLNKSSFSQLAAGLRSRRQSLGYSSLSPVGGTKVQPGSLSSEDESQRPNLCRICGKTYARPSTLKTHLRTHSGEKPYRCGDCNKSFSQAANLTAHVRTHSGEKPFRCPICDRRFSQSSSVTTHMRTHSGERPYRCRMCKKAFSDSSTLTKHLRIHSGEKPYQCKLCLLRFSQSGNLNRHMRVHGTNNQLLG